MVVLWMPGATLLSPVGYPATASRIDTVAGGICPNLLTACGPSLGSVALADNAVLPAILSADSRPHRSWHVILSDHSEIGEIGAGLGTHLGSTRARGESDFHPTASHPDGVSTLGAAHLTEPRRALCSGALLGCAHTVTLATVYTVVNTSVDTKSGWIKASARGARGHSVDSVRFVNAWRGLPSLSEVPLMRPPGDRTIVQAEMVPRLQRGTPLELGRPFHQITAKRGADFEGATEFWELLSTKGRHESAV